MKTGYIFALIGAGVLTYIVYKNNTKPVNDLTIDFDRKQILAHGKWMNFPKEGEAIKFKEGFSSIAGAGKAEILGITRQTFDFIKNGEKFYNFSKIG